ncbi:MAG: LUD domain-containing protein [Pirellulales bacterium]
MTSIRDRLLTGLKKQILPEVPLPEVVDGNWVTYPDPIAKFKEMLEFVGGSCIRVQSEDEIEKRLSVFPQWQQRKRTFSAVESVPGNVTITDTADPHDLEDLDFVIYRGQFAVAENGAVWLTDQSLKHRVVFFITQYLVLVVSEKDIVHNMHEAYRRAQPPRPGFGLFLSGPSKTADIEQSLVIGAHGCRQLQVYLVP